MDTILYIKNMVCNRCIRVVREDLEKLGFKIKSIELGKIAIEGDLSTENLDAIDKTLTAGGFELINDRQSQLIEQIKKIIIEHIYHRREKPEHQNFSDYLARQTGRNYFHLSKLFPSLQGVTIEKYIILQKIERAKELLVYGEQNLSEIAYELGYNNVAHLSRQFKKVTGLTPTAFRKLTEPRRSSIDQVGRTK